MKKQTEKPPIDDLFARKLGDLSLSPSADAFDRLQARMNGQKSDVGPLFWRNPLMQRYMAVAACLLLICLFGWQYWSENAIERTSEIAVVKKPHRSQTDEARLAQQSKPETKPGQNTIGLTNLPMEHPDVAVKEAVAEQPAASLIHTRTNRRSEGLQVLLTNPNPVLATNKPAGNVGNVSNELTMTNRKPSVVPAPDEPTAGVKPAEQVARVETRSVPVNERVLVVTIAEPADLAAAKVPIETTTVLAGTGKEDTKAPHKLGNFWQQVKRVKTGDAFASRANANDERGLLDRAYTELKQNFDKDKSQKR